MLTPGCVVSLDAVAQRKEPLPSGVCSVMWLADQPERNLMQVKTVFVSLGLDVGSNLPWMKNNNLFVFLFEVTTLGGAVGGTNMSASPLKTKHSLHHVQCLLYKTWTGILRWWRVFSENYYYLSHINANILQIHPCVYLNSFRRRGLWVTIMLCWIWFTLQDWFLMYVL